MQIAAHPNVLTKGITESKELTRPFDLSYSLVRTSHTVDELIRPTLLQAENSLGVDQCLDECSAWQL